MLENSLGDAPVKYLVLIWSNPASRAIWDSFSDEQRAEGFRYYGALTDELAARVARDLDSEE